MQGYWFLLKKVLYLNTRCGYWTKILVSLRKLVLMKASGGRWYNKNMPIISHTSREINDSETNISPEYVYEEKFKIVDKKFDIVKEKFRVVHSPPIERSDIKTNKN